jgi:hypothetical protein
MDQTTCGQLLFINKLRQSRFFALAKYANLRTIANCADFHRTVGWEAGDSCVAAKTHVFVVTMPASRGFSLTSQF